MHMTFPCISERLLQTKVLVNGRRQLIGIELGDEVVGPDLLDHGLVEDATEGGV